MVVHNSLTAITKALSNSVGRERHHSEHVRAYNDMQKNADQYASFEAMQILASTSTQRLRKKVRTSPSMSPFMR